MLSDFDRWVQAIGGTPRETALRENLKARTPEQLAAQCAAHEQHAIGLTDVHGVYGSPRLHYTAKRLGIKALVGAEIGYDPGV